MPGITPAKRRAPARLAPYLKGSRAALTYDVRIVAEQDSFYTVYHVAVTASDGSEYRHLLVVPTNVSAASFDVGLALVEADSVQADLGQLRRIEQLASALKWDYQRYCAFPPPAELNRFCM